MRRTAFGPCPAAYADAEGVGRGGVGSTVKSLTAHGTEQILLPDLHLRVDDRVEIRVGRPGSSSELETELIAQSVSLSGEKLQSLFQCCRVEVRLVRDPRVAEEVEGWSGSISGVGDWRYSGFRKSEAL